MGNPVKTFLQRHHLAIFFAVWFLLNLIQAAGTQLMDDEAYYWVYSRFLDWGYFDHPPMIAVLIKAGCAIFPGELGVRFFIAVIGTLTMFILYQLLPRRNDKVFYLIAASMAVLQIGGILAVPDIPLLFFTSLFFLAYRRFLQNSSWLNGLLLGIVMALLLYSKYHGIVVIVCVLLSNYKLILKPQAWLAVIVGVAVFSPHLYWQWQHGFPSVKYHLYERNAYGYKFAWTSEYVLGQIALAGPIMGWLLLWAAFKYKTTSLFERALKFTIVGVYVFFLVSTFKGRVEANWTIPVFVPLVVLSHQQLLLSPRWTRWLQNMALVTLIPVLLIRLYMLTDIKAITSHFHDEMHNNKPWIAAVHERAGDAPVVFINSYQAPSKYMFYSGGTALDLNTPYYRRTNYNIWPIENEFCGKTILYVSNREKQEMTKVDNYYSFSSIAIAPESRKLIATNGRLQTLIKITASANVLDNIKKSPLGNEPIKLYLFQKDERLGTLTTNLTLQQITDTNQALTLDVPLTLSAGKYTIRIALPTAITDEYSLNSSIIQLEVK